MNQENIDTLRNYIEKGFVDDSELFNLPKDKLDEFTIRVGKYKDKKFKDVFNEDVKYCKFIVKKVDRAGSPLSLFRHYISLCIA